MTTVSDKIHPTAIVHPDAQIAEGVEIGPWCTVGANVKIGKNTRLISHVVVDGWTTLGESNTVFPFAVIGAVPQDLKYKGEKTYLEVGNHNTIRESVTLNLGTVQGGGVTRIGDHNLLMAYVHVGHDATIGSHCILANSVGIAGHVTVQDWANIGGYVGVTQFVKVGAHSFIGAFTPIDKDIPPFSVVISSRVLSVKGANIVGMRRRGFSAEVITKINEALKLWARPDTPKDQCMAEIELQYGEVPEIKSLLSFVKSSDAGVLR
jgi:UDP-N-acetylglucosamine acyltransferase